MSLRRRSGILFRWIQLGQCSPAAAGSDKPAAAGAELKPHHLWLPSVSLPQQPWEPEPTMHPQNANEDAEAPSHPREDGTCAPALVGEVGAGDWE